MTTKAVRYTQPLLGSTSTDPHLVAVHDADEVLITQDGVACDVFADNDKTPLENPVTLGVGPGTAGVSTRGELLVYLEAGRGYGAQVTVGADVTTVAFPDVSPDVDDVQGPIAPGTYAKAVLTAEAVAETNVALAGLPTTDGRALTVGDHVLLTAQDDATENGPWRVSAGAWTRPPDFAAGSVVAGLSVLVTGGILRSGSVWGLATAGIMVDTSPQRWLLTPGRPLDLMRDFGADPTGQVDMSGALADAMERASALGVDGNNASGTIGGVTEPTDAFGGEALYSGSAPIVWIPYGVYKAETGNIPFPKYCTVVADRAIIVVPDDVDLFTGLSYDATIRGLTVRGGRHIISLATTNLDTVVVNIDECGFIGHQGDAIRDDGTSYSTILNVTRSKFSSSATTSRVLNVGVDQCNFSENWVTSGADEVFRITHGVLHVVDSLGVPRNNTGVWVKNVGGSVNFERFRFGGEGGGGKRILDNYTEMYTAVPVNPNFVVFKDCQTYSLAASPAYQFFGLPNIVVIDDGNGYPSVAKGIYFDPAIANNSKKYIGTYGYFRVNGNVLDLPAVCATSDPLVTSAMLKSRAISKHEHLRSADRLLTIPMTSSAFGQSQNATNATVATTTNQVFGQAMAEVTATANDGLWARIYSTALAGFADGPYTFVVEIEVVNKPVQFKLTAANRAMLQALDVGRHIISLPFVVNAAAGTDTVLRVDATNLTSGAVFKIAAFRVFAGETVVTTSNTVVYGSAAPTAGDWFRGDLVWNTAPGNTLAWVCTASGTPGTWTAVGIVDLTQKLTATGGVRLGDGVDTSATVLLAIGQATANAFASIGQGPSNNLQFGWVYNATPASAKATINTFGYSNAMDIDASLIRLQANSAQRVIVGGGASPVGFYGSNGAAKQTLAAAATDAATTQGLANDLRSKLIALGLFA